MAISTAFDPLFRQRGKAIPVPFLRVLSKAESDQNPRETGGSHWGLLQVGRSVVEGYNERHGTRYTLSDVLDPNLNVTMGAETLSRIATSYSKNHPDSRHMRKDWSNPEFVKLVLAGWNSGYSERGGVGRVARYLEQRKIPVTHDNVFQYADAAGATVHLQNPKKRAWQRAVSGLYFAQPDRPRGAAGLLAAAAVLFVGWGIYRLATP